MLELFRGTSKERRAEILVRSLSQKRTPLTEIEQTQFKAAQGLSRRLFLRRAVGSSVGAASMGGLATLVWRLHEADREATEEFLEATYKYYTEGFKNLAEGNSEAEEVYSFVQQKRKRAIIEGKNFFAKDSGNKKDLYTTVVDPRLHPQIFSGMRGIAEYKTNQFLTVLLLKNVPVTQVWAGAIAGHEYLHAYRRANGIQSTIGQDPYVEEVDAYKLQFKLLDKFTEGRFSNALKEEATTITIDKSGDQLSPVDERKFEALFPTYMSIEEISVRHLAYPIAITFAIIDLTAQNATVAHSRKVEFLRKVNADTCAYPQTV